MNAAATTSTRRCPTETPRQKQGEGGFTLLEVMISMAVLAILVVGIYMALASSQSLYLTGVTRNEIQDRVRRALNEVAMELRQASAGTGSVTTFGTAGTAGDQSVSFCICTGFTAGAATWSTPILYTTIDGDADGDDGVDNNNNRLTDERILIRTQGVRTRRIADNVKEGTFRLTPALTGGMVDRVRIELTIQGVDDKGRTIEASGDVTVDLRNQ